MISVLKDGMIDYPLLNASGIHSEATCRAIMGRKTCFKGNDFFVIFFRYISNADIDYDDPKTFVDVMGDVIDVKYREALKRVSFFKSVKYGFRIQGDIQKRNLTTTEFIKMMWNRMRGNDL